MAALTVSINGDNSQLARALQGAQAHVNKFAGAISLKLQDVFKANIYQNLVNAAAKLLSDPVNKLKEAFAQGAELDALHLRTGAAVKDLVALRKAFKESDLSAEAIGPTINKMQAALGGLNEQGEDTKSIFHDLGLDAAELKKQSPVAQLVAVGNAINKLGDASQRAYAARKIFGKGGGEMLQFFNNKNAMADAAAGGGTLGAIMQKNSALFQRINYLIGAAGGKVKQLWAGIATGVAPALLPILEKFNKLDFAKWGQQIGNAIAIFLQAFRDGRMSELLGLSLKIGAMKGANFLDHALRGALTLIPEYLAQAAEMMGEDLKLLTTPEFWAGLINVLAGAATKFGAYLLDAFRRPIVLLQSGMEWIFQQLLADIASIPGLGKLLGGDFSKPESIDEITKRNMEEGPTFFGQTSADLKQLGDEELSKGGADLMPLIKERLSQFQDRAGRLGKSFLEGFGNSGDLFDTKGAEGQFGRMIETLRAHAEKTTAAAQGEEREGGTGSADFGHEKNKVIASSLAKIGGGGNFAGGTLGLQREANSLLRKIVANTSLKTGSLKTGPVQGSGPLNAVFG